MESNLEHKPLKSFLAEKPRNGLYKGKEHQGSGNRWIKMNEVFSLDFISNENTTEKLIVTESEVERFSCKSGDLLFGRTSLTLEGVGDCLLVQDIFDQPIFESNLFRLRFDLAKAYPLFFYYFFKSHYGRQIIQRIAKQTAATSITATDLIEEDVPNLSYSDQVKIANSLYRFDKKIYLNQQTNQTLEQMAQALFKSWFVDFDPVFDNLLASIDFKLENLETSLPDELKQKAQRRLVALDSLENVAQYKASLSALAHELQAQLPTKEAPQATVSAAETPVRANFNANPNILAQHANTHAHFPNEFEHNEQLGWIPKDWSVDKADKVADIAIGKTPPRKQKEWFSDNPLNNKVWVSIKDMGGNKIFIGDSSEYLTSESISKFNVKVVPKDSVILSFKLTLGRVCITKCDLTTNEAIAHFVNPKHSMSKEYIYLYLKCFDYGSLGSTSSIATAVNSKIIKAMPFLVPNKTVLSSFKGSVENIFFKMDTLESETTSLTKLRDSLLPKLISGELQIPDVVTDEEVVD